MRKGQSTMESWMMANGKAGQSFYSEKSDAAITALANYYKRKVSTERLVLITSAKRMPVAKYIVKVTLLF